MAAENKNEKWSIEQAIKDHPAFLAYRGASAKVLSPAGFEPKNDEGGDGAEG